MKERATQLVDLLPEKELDAILISHPGKPPLPVRLYRFRRLPAGYPAAAGAVHRLPLHGAGRQPVAPL